MTRYIKFFIVCILLPQANGQNYTQTTHTPGYNAPVYIQVQPNNPLEDVAGGDAINYRTRLLDQSIRVQQEQREQQAFEMAQQAQQRASPEVDINELKRLCKIVEQLNAGIGVSVTNSLAAIYNQFIAPYPQYYGLVINRKNQRYQELIASSTHGNADALAILNSNQTELLKIDNLAKAMAVYALAISSEQGSDNARRACMTIFKRAISAANQ